MASIDHAMWFHRPARVDEWLLYVLDSPTASGARGLCAGQYLQPGRAVGRIDRPGRAGAAQAPEYSGRDRSLASRVTVTRSHAGISSYPNPYFSARRGRG